MRFISHGDKTSKSLMLIHGMANTSDLFDPLLPYLKDYYVIVCELDGHSQNEAGDFVSVEDSAQKVERYVKDNLNGNLYGVLGFSLGGTIATELISRGNIEVDRTVLDAAFVIKMGIMTYPFKWLFQGSIWSTKKNIHVPKSLYENKLSTVFDDLAAARETLDRVREFVRNHPTVYLSTHSPQGYENLEAKRVIDLDNPVETIFEEFDFNTGEATGKYICSICGYVYDPAEHDGVAFEDQPDDFKCPRCKQGKDKFNPA